MVVVAWGGSGGGGGGLFCSLAVVNDQWKSFLITARNDGIQFVFPLLFLLSLSPSLSPPPLSLSAHACMQRVPGT